MKKISLITVLFACYCLTAAAQTVTPVTPATPAAPLIGPSMLVSEGVQWQRGATYPLVDQTSFAKQISGTSWYSWTTVTTPFTSAAAGSPPVASSLSTGGAYVAAQSATGSVSLVMIAQAGFASTGATTTASNVGVATTSTTSAVFTGNVGVAIVPFKSHPNFAIFPYCAGQGAVGGSMTSFILQPGISVMYGFGKAK